MSANDNKLPDGIYVNLKAEDYFAQDRIGSTDLTVLHSAPADWWYKSRHNPNRPEREASDEMAFGSALHALLLEGEAVYAKTVTVRPDTYEDAKTGDAKKWNGNATVCKEWLEANDRPGVTIIDTDADRRVRHMAELIRNHPELGAPIDAGLSEVSVLWTDPSGVKMRARFDKLLPRFVLDLKTFGGDAKGNSVRQQCLTLVANRQMDVQRYSYAQARDAMAGFIKSGAVFGATPTQVEWLKKVSVIHDWQWGWVFYRRQDDKKGHAPVVKPILRSPGDATFIAGGQKTAVAIKNYLTFVDRFGFDVPWAVVEATEEPADHEFPPWIERVHEPVTFPKIHKDAA